MKNTYESICMYRLYTKRRWMCNILWKSGCVKYEKGMKCLQKITSVDSSPICLIIRLLAKQIGTNCLAIYVINRKERKRQLACCFAMKAYCFLFVYHKQCEYFDQTKELFMPVRNSMFLTVGLTREKWISH